MAQLYSEELGVDVIPFEEMVYVPSLGTYKQIKEAKAEGLEFVSISGTKLRKMLEDGEELPEWFTYPEVAQILERANPPKSEQGFVVFLTGLPSSGKSTIGNRLAVKLKNLSLDEKHGRTVSVLDGDVVRNDPARRKLGFSREDRDINVVSVGIEAIQIANARGIAIVALVSPYEETRERVREIARNSGIAFFEVFVDTPVEVAETRDPKGNYAKARRGEISNFTGVNDPYEQPQYPDIIVKNAKEGAERMGTEAIL